MHSSVTAPAVEKEPEEYGRRERGAAMVLNLFGGLRVRPGMEEREARLSDKLYEIVRAMPGFISYKTYTAEDGEEIGIIRFDTRILSRVGSRRETPRRPGSCTGNIRVVLGAGRRDLP
jgi:hypothetical protein